MSAELILAGGAIMIGVLILLAVLTLRLLTIVRPRWFDG